MLLVGFEAARRMEPNYVTARMKCSCCVWWTLCTCKHLHIPWWIHYTIMHQIYRPLFQLEHIVQSCTIFSILYCQFFSFCLCVVTYSTCNYLLIFFTMLIGDKNSIANYLFLIPNLKTFLAINLIGILMRWKSSECSSLQLRCPFNQRALNTWVVVGQRSWR